MNRKLYLIIVAVAISLSSCLKQSIADAMLHPSGNKKVTATLSYEINGTQANISVEDADRQIPGAAGCIVKNQMAMYLGQ